MKHLSNYQVIQTLTDRQKDALIRASIESMSSFLRDNQLVPSAFILFTIGEIGSLAIRLGLLRVSDEVVRWRNRELAKL